MPPRLRSALPVAPPVPFLAAPRPVYALREVAAAVQICEPSSMAGAVPEALVQDLWHHQRFDAADLQTRDGDPVVVFDPGTPNTDAGPDFLDARVQIGGMEWRGDVEIHVASRVWFDHAHHDDPRYDSVILHVTLQADAWTGGLTRADGTRLPEIVLYPRLEASLRRLTHAFYTRSDDDALPCASRWDEVPEAVTRDWIDRLAEERLLNKRNRLAERADEGGVDNLAPLLQERLYAGLGYAKNDPPMTMLAERLPLDRLRAMDDRRDVEALHFGAAGLLPEPKDLLDADRPTADYAMDLRARFRQLQVELQIPPMDATAWTFFRLRPNNVPPLRIAQATAWFADDGLLSRDPLPLLRDALVSETPVRDLRRLLRATPSGFWRTHYRLTTSTSDRDPRLGRARTDTLIVNAVVPVLLLDADRRGDTAQSDAALNLVHALPAGRDHILRRFRDLGTPARDAFEAQGLHRLYRAYCQPGRCLTCAIGRWLLDGDG